METSFACAICASSSQPTPLLQSIKESEEVFLAQITKNNHLSVLKVARGSAVKVGSELSDIEIPAPLFRFKQIWTIFYTLFIKFRTINAQRCI